MPVLRVRQEQQGQAGFDTAGQSGHIVSDLRD
jgi:hypothetical protein